MPYIPKDDRKSFEPELTDLKDLMSLLTGKGELTYLVYSLALEYFKEKKSYTTISTAISCLNDAAEEIRRRHLNPYEDKKIEENGDV